MFLTTKVLAKFEGKVMIYKNLNCRKKEASQLLLLLPGDGIGLVVLDFFFMAFWALSWAREGQAWRLFRMISSQRVGGCESIWITNRDLKIFACA